MKSKSLYAVFLTVLMMGNCFAVELVCKGRSPENPQQRIVLVDCSNRKAVIDMLGSAWSTLRKEGIGGNTEDLCWKPYQKAKQLHPSIEFDNIAPSFFMQCNMALKYVK
jgi:hypothetical protein